MNPPIIPDEYTDNNSKNHFPIVLQLSLLTLVLCGLFGSLWLANGGYLPIQQPNIAYTTVALDTSTVADLPGKIADIDIRADSAYVWDVRGQRALFKKNERETMPLASITKLMTALITHELLTDQTSITVPATAIRQEGDSGLASGEVLSVEELNELALMTSSNDAAYSLAASVGSYLGDRDPVEQFVTAMNIRADELNLNSLQFSNMTGLDVSNTQPGAVGTARDVSFLLEHIIEHYPGLLSSTQQTEGRVYNNSGQYHDVSNTNVIANRVPNMIGSKTGYTDLAGGNLTLAFDLGHDRPIIITVLGSTRDERFTDVLTLVEAVQQSVTLAYE